MDRLAIKPSPVIAAVPEGAGVIEKRDEKQ
jgi:hypothetical protein